MGYPLIFDQGIIDKCRERMPLAILGKCSLEDTFGRDLPPTIEEYRKIIQSKAVNDDDSDGSYPMIGVVVPRNLNTEGGIAPTTAASPTAPTAVWVPPPPVVHPGWPAGYSPFKPGGYPPAPAKVIPHPGFGMMSGGFPGVVFVGPGGGFGGSGFGSGAFGSSGLPGGHFG
jgi:hypothetical protein